MWIITVSYTRCEDNWSCAYQLPSFVLFESIQGFATEAQAIEIARRIVNSNDCLNAVNLYIVAYRIGDEP